MADLNALERFLFNAGLRTPASRMVVGGLVGAAAMWMLKPGFAFDAAGNALPFGPGATTSSGAQSSTRFPWYLGAVAGAAALGLFI